MTINLFIVVQSTGYCFAKMGINDKNSNFKHFRAFVEVSCVILSKLLNNTLAEL